jgi:hypothetical protein
VRNDRGARHGRGLGGGGHDLTAFHAAADASAFSMASSGDLAGWHLATLRMLESGLVGEPQRLTRKRIFARWPQCPTIHDATRL